MIEMASVAALSTPFLEGLLANYDGKIELDQTAALPRDVCSSLSKNEGKAE
ncbi:UNVERIFIED_CONTAM: hypothetical protein HDU68_011552 [Siphonaria sp. JEL0065]|nr:hypothetical protein HDU68_011552 [Siphonaria sp. JEL0065]